MLHIEGMEITRGTKNIIQESIDSINTTNKNDRIIICQEFCRIVEERYTGGAMSYQLKRMGNTYPIDFLTKNEWTVKDALENNLLVYLDEKWFTDKEYTMIDNQYYYTKQLAVTQSDKNASSTHSLEFDDKVFLDDLQSMNLELVNNMNDFHPDKVKLVHALIPVANEEVAHLDNKLFWLEDIVATDVDSNIDDILNYTKEQAKANGLMVALTPSVKIPLSTTAPILEAIDKYLYDTTGEYQM